MSSPDKSAAKKQPARQRAQAVKGVDEKKDPNYNPPHETGSIIPPPESAPVEGTIAPQTTPPEPPPSDNEGVADVVPVADPVDLSSVAEASTYVTSPAEPGEIVAGGIYTPPPPDIWGPIRRVRRS